MNTPARRRRMTGRTARLKWTVPCTAVRPVLTHRQGHVVHDNREQHAVGGPQARHAGALPVLQEDHKTVGKLFKRFEKTDEDAWDKKGQLVGSIIEEEILHRSMS